MDKDFCGVYCAKIFGDAMGTNISSRANLIDEYLLHGSWASDAIKSVYYGRYRPPRYPDNMTYNGYPLVNKAIEDTTTCEEHPDMTQEQAAYNMYPNSYCSGHASAIWGVACILAYIYPSNFTDIFKRAWVFANNRVVSRYHFYSDTIVGRELGGLILPTLMYYDKFRNSL
jgi:membrane-associated phospholipid phosphatase